MIGGGAAILRTDLGCAIQRAENESDQRCKKLPGAWVHSYNIAKSVVLIGNDIFIPRFDLFVGIVKELCHETVHIGTADHM